MEEPKTPELERLSVVAAESNKIGEFLDWLEHKKGIVYATYNEDDELQSAYIDKNKKLAEFFGIDLDKVESERRALLDYVREINK